jgi:DNA mismatch repair protein MutL
MIAGMHSPDGLPRIGVLPQFLANRIAAGEVIERPASVVKELVENSLDAQAARVDIDIERGGIDAIRVVDDGHGIHPDDMAIALHRHATSKVRTQDDLDRIISLGFRGEALPSIASVARLRLVSRIAESGHGWVVDFDPVSGGMQRQPAAHPVGTSVEVTALFSAVPARRRFLRSERTEFLHVLDTARRLALSRPGTAMRLSSCGRVVFSSPGNGDYQRTASTLLGPALASRLRRVDDAAGLLCLSGAIGDAGVTRSQSDQQYFFLNGRMIRDRRLNHAVRMAFDDTMPSGRFPVYLLYLDMDPAAADVNVHPTKHEVRFRNGRDVHDFVLAALRRALQVNRSGSGPAAPERTGGFAIREAGFPSGGRPAAFADAGASALGSALGCLDGRYILSRRGSDWLLIDARALLQRRLRHEIAAVRSAAGRLPSRPLLVPCRIQVAGGSEALVEQMHETLERWGVAMTVAAPGQVMLRTVPLLLQDADAGALVHTVLEVMADTANQAELSERLAAVLPEQVPANPCRGQEIGELSALLACADLAGVDAGARTVPGLWRTLDAELAAALVGRHAGR